MSFGMKGAAESLLCNGDRGARRSAVAHHEAPPPGGRSDAGGSREKTAGRAKPVAVAVVMPKHDGFSWGGTPRPQPRRAEAWARYPYKRVQRAVRRPCPRVKRPAQRDHEVMGAPVFMSA